MTLTPSSIVFALLTAVWGLDALRMRRRARALRTLAPSNEAPSPDQIFLVREGVVLDEATRRAASAHMHRENLEALDVVPGNVSGWRSLLLLQSVDPATFRATRLANGHSAGDVLVVTRRLVERMGLPLPAHGDITAFAEFASKVKQHAPLAMDVAVGPHLSAGPDAIPGRARLLQKLFGELALTFVILQIAIAMIAPALNHGWGVAALAAMHLQIVIATVGTALSPRGRFLYFFLRTPIDLVTALCAFASSGKQAAREAEARKAYETLLANGLERFFEPRRADCPVCGSDKLSVRLTATDRLQFKPGSFTLERCEACQHIFQNPRLSIEGLDFYYRDFYDGLGEERLDKLFAAYKDPYVARAKMVEGKAPERWLDVGAGHGHFCCVAKDVWPETRFDGLDLGESIEGASRRGWIDRAYRGLFPDLARTIAERTRYDVVSMSHYLEHTRDPRAEIEAAAEVLDPGGVLMIEVPDPESRLGDILGSFWIPWFQPQHQHFLSARNLERMLRENAFEPIVWHRGEAHLTIDFTWFTYLFLSKLAQPLDRPWQATKGRALHGLVRIWNRIVWTFGIPLVAISWIIDKLLGPLLRREGWSNTYRVLARRVA